MHVPKASNDAPAAVRRYDATWYDKILALLANVTDDDHAFIASETYANISYNATALVVDPQDVAVDGVFIPPGPLLGRVVLGAAEVAIGNQTAIPIEAITI